jgi:hypothetical protein
LSKSPIDEWRAITANLGKPAADAIKALLTESRKAAFSVFVATGLSPIWWTNR